jgi:hypothetical protein
VAEIAPKSRELAPLTDPRSLSSSLILHIGVIALASLLVFGVAHGTRDSEPKILRGEIGPIDNRIPHAEGGGSPGPLGSASPPPAIRISAASPSARDTTAEGLLAEALAAPPSRDDPSPPPGPPTSGLGPFPGAGSGGGGGSGGGYGGGVGRGIGPSTEFFGARERAGSFSYVIDISGSMAEGGALDLAKRELLASLGVLPPDARFGVILYNLQTIELADSRGQPGLMPATAANKEQARARLAAVRADGGTDPRAALVAAFAQRPEVIFFLTDGQFLTRETADEMEKAARGTRILAVEFGRGPNPGTTDHLRSLAIATGGSYRYIDVTRYRTTRE